jgi:hypothetical protein
LAAAALLGAQPLYAVKLTDKGLPEFGKLNIEDAGEVPAVAKPLADNLGDDLDTSYNFDIPLQFNGSITEAIDINNNLMLRVTRNSYGNYGVEIMVEGGSASFDAIKTGDDDYLLRGDQVNLTFTRNTYENYYDVSGDIPTADGTDKLNMRLTVEQDGSLSAYGSGYDFRLAAGRLTGNVDTAQFSKADLAALASFSVAMRADGINPEPWHPAPPPPPWVPHPYDPYHPGPWHPGPHPGPFPPGPHPQPVPPGPHPGPFPPGPHPQPVPPQPHPQPVPPQPHPQPVPPQPHPQPVPPQPHPQPVPPQPHPQPVPPQPHPQPVPPQPHPQPVPPQPHPQPMPPQPHPQPHPQPMPPQPHPQPMPPQPHPQPGPMPGPHGPHKAAAVKSVKKAAVKKAAVKKVEVSTDTVAK